MARDWTRNALGLKLLIAGMTALLVAGLVLLIVGMARTAGELGRGGAAAPAGFGELRLPVPAGARLEGVTADGGRLYLDIRDNGGRSQLLVVDAAEGRLLGRIVLEPGP